MSKVLILNNIRSAHNVGAILRTADGAGIDKVYLCGITPTGTHSKVEKTALGAENFVDWEYKANILKLCTTLREEEYTIVSIEQTDDSISYSEYDYPNHTALILGHEISGVEPEVLAITDACIHIPMRGKKESLNVATAAGIISYEVTRVNNDKKRSTKA